VKLAGWPALHGYGPRVARARSVLCGRGLAPLLVVLLLAGCFGAAGQTKEHYHVPLRLLDADGIEWPRDATNDLHYALALVPGTIFGVADRTTLRQFNAEKAYLDLDMTDLSAWAAKGAQTWHHGDSEPFAVTPNDTKMARIIPAAYAGKRGSRFGVGFHDLLERRNLALLYVDRGCKVQSPASGTAPDSAADGGAAAGAARYALDLPHAGLYWVRMAPGEPIEGLDPGALSIELRMHEARVAPSP